MSRGGFSHFEVIGIVIVTMVSSLALWNGLFWPAPQVKFTVDPKFAATFAARYGPEHFSSGLEEYIVRDFFQDRHDGVFVDVGAYHARVASNTYRLERDLGWSGLAIDVNAAFAADYATLRPRTRFITAFVGDVDGGMGTLHLAPEQPDVASYEATFTAEWRTPTTTISAPRRTLTSLLSEHAVTRVDFLSMDIELGEPAALAGFDIARFRPALVCIEAHYPVRQAILDYFARAGYVLVGKYAQADPLNYYFAPLGSAPAP